jgi:hypothetical protein
MANKVSEAGSRVGEVVAPRSTKLEQFRSYWKAVDTFFDEMARHAELDDPNIMLDKGMDRNLAKIIELMQVCIPCLTTTTISLSNHRAHAGGGGGGAGGSASISRRVPQARRQRRRHWR